MPIWFNRIKHETFCLAERICAGSLYWFIDEQNKWKKGIGGIDLPTDTFLVIDVKTTYDFGYPEKKEEEEEENECWDVEIS